MSDTGEGFLSRWSRLKRTEAVPAAPATPPAVPDTDPAHGQSAEDADERPRDPETGAVIDLEWVKSLPRIDDLAPGADLSGFMRAGVPEALRREALRRVWEIDPVIRDFVSPALDYAYDYNTPGAAPGYGPLSESDIAQAKRFLETVFSDPPEMRKNTDTPKPVSAHSPDCDVESQGEIAQATAAAAPNERESDAALRRGRDDAVTAESVDSLSSGDQERSVQSIQTFGDSPDHAAVHQTSEPAAAPVLPRRRRGGGATPA